MSTLVDDEIKRRTARRKSALVLEIIQGDACDSSAPRPDMCATARQLLDGDSYRVVQRGRTRRRDDKESGCDLPAVLRPS